MIDSSANPSGRALDILAAVQVGAQVFQTLNLRGGGKKEIAAGLAISCASQSATAVKLCQQTLADPAADAGELRGALVASVMALGLAEGSMKTIAEVLGFEIGEVQR